MKKLLLISFLLVFLTGCETFSLFKQKELTKPVEVITISKREKMYHPPLPMELQFADIDWTVWTPELMKEYLVLIESGEAPIVAYYALTSKEYENLSNNMAEVKRYTKNLLSIVKFYRDYDKEEEEVTKSQE